MTEQTSPELLLTVKEVARLFRVDPKTVTRWANQGRLPSLTTPGGQRRFPRAEVMRLVNMVESAQ